MASQARPYIGINVDYVGPSKNAGPQLRLHAGYAEAVYQSGGIPLLIPPGLKENELEDLFDKLDGIVLTSCNLDMDPKKMGLAPHSAVTPMPARREESDRLLTQMVIDRQTPVLAISVGMQMLNVLCGGSLFLHLPEDQPKALPHKDVSGGAHRHIVLLEPGTRIDSIYGGGEIRVNSYHHQAIENVAPGFRIGAKSPDGIIEAIESEDSDWFAMGVQWHPHSETASALDMQLFEVFLQSCAKQELRLQLAA